MAQTQTSFPRPGATGPAERRHFGISIESRPALLTTEYWLTLLFATVVLVAGYVSDGLGVRPAWIIAGAVIVAYVVSRGLSKAGSPDTYVEE